MVVNLQKMKTGAKLSTMAQLIHLASSWSLTQIIIQKKTAQISKYKIDIVRITKAGKLWNWCALQKWQ